MKRRNEATPPPTDARKLRRRSSLCMAGCGQAVECGPLGWWPCCSKSCLKIWKNRPPAMPAERIEWPPRQQAAGGG
ncbi:MULTISPECIES: hypothetical protein [Variovorax]|uniref:Uncharacterized protein n=1 Tax=Variovorax guangxiensis TaxID=1775474 RepID=A0A840FMI6_9BURK|nr:hypothetical protein [Variovorax guangxiensis]MBB4223003.1 hypothetical protein [Variovorax guangxiensis]